MDAERFISDYHDYLAPKLDTYEQAVYLYLVRHTRYAGVLEDTIGLKSARRRMAMGIGKARTPMSERICYDKVRSLHDKGCIEILGTEQAGTRVRVRLPHEIDGVMPTPADRDIEQLEELDFFTIPENRLRILAREDHRCFYCLRELSSENHVIEHVVSRPDGDNSYQNLVAACRQCNNRKGSESAEGFFRVLYREALLDSKEFKAGLSRLADLRAGKLLPPAV